MLKTFTINEKQIPMQKKIEKVNERRKMYVKEFVLLTTQSTHFRNSWKLYTAWNDSDFMQFIKFLCNSLIFFSNTYERIVLKMHPQIFFKIKIEKQITYIVRCISNEISNFKNS